MQILSKFHLLTVLAWVSIASGKEFTFLSILYKILYDLSCLPYLFCASSHHFLNSILPAMLNSLLNQNTVQSHVSSTLLLLPSTSIPNVPAHFFLSPPPPKYTNILTHSHLQVRTFLEASPDLTWVWGSCVPKHLVCFPVMVFITISPFIYPSSLCTASNLKTRNVSFTFLYLYFWELIECLGCNILSKCFLNK